VCACPLVPRSLHEHSTDGYSHSAPAGQAAPLLRDFVTSCETENASVFIRAEAVVVLDGPDLNFAFQALIENLHYHQEAAPEA